MSYRQTVVLLFLLSCFLALAACEAPSASPTLLPPATPVSGTATPGAQATAATSQPTASASVGPITGTPPAGASPTAVLGTAVPTATTLPPATTATASAALPTAIPPKDASRSDPILMLAAYYDAISRKDYRAAAGYLVREGDATPDAAAANKVAQKYAGVTVVMPVVNPLYARDGAAGSVYVSIQTLLVMTKSGGGQRYMTGCIVARHAQPGNFDPPRDTGWHVYSESLKDTPTANANLLAQGCDNAPPPPRTDDLSSPPQVLASLYDAINRHDYPRAYGYWESPPQGMSEAQFAAGYADTVSVLVGVRPPVHIEGAAGSQYAPLPAILISQHTNQSKEVFVGCYTARRVNPGVAGPNASSGWHMYAGKFAAAPGNTANASLLATTACP